MLFCSGKMGASQFEPNWERSSATATEDNLYASDKLSDRFRDAISEGLPMKPVMNRKEALDGVTESVLDVLQTITAKRNTDEKRASLDAQQIWESVRALIGYILNTDNMGLTVHVIAYAAGLYELQNKPMRELAEQFGVSKQAFSKRVVFFLTEFGIPPTANMRSTEQRAIYKAAQKKRNLQLNNPTKKHAKQLN